MGGTLCTTTVNMTLRVSCHYDLLSEGHFSILPAITAIFSIQVNYCSVDEDLLHVGRALQGLKSERKLSSMKKRRRWDTRDETRKSSVNGLIHDKMAKWTKIDEKQQLSLWTGNLFQRKNQSLEKWDIPGDNGRCRHHRLRHLTLIKI